MASKAAIGHALTLGFSRPEQLKPESKGDLIDHHTCIGEFLMLNLKPKNPHHCHPAYQITWSFS